MPRDDLDRGLKRLAWEQQPAAQARRDKEMKTLMLQGEMKHARRKLEAGGFPDMAALDISPDEFMLTVKHWPKSQIVAVLTVLPHLRQMLIDLDQAGIFRDTLAVEAAFREMMWAEWETRPDDDWEWDGGEWNYDRETYGHEEEE